MTTRAVGDYRLTEKQRDALELHLSGKTVADIARQLGISRSTVTDRLRRGRYLLDGQRIAKREVAG